jgi:hypothetical protein
MILDILTIELSHTSYHFHSWWFQTFLIFHYGIILPIDFHIFQRGGSTTNQISFSSSNLRHFTAFAAMVQPPSTSSCRAISTWNVWGVPFAAPLVFHRATRWRHFHDQQLRELLKAPSRT